MKRMAIEVVDCEHEGDVNYAVMELREVGEIDNVSYQYEYEDDEDPDADHEICGCTIYFECKNKDVSKFTDFGAYIINY